MIKLIVLVGMFLLAMSFISSSWDTKEYSKPTHKDSSEIQWKEPTANPILKEVSHMEWNKIFSDWKSGEVSKEETIRTLKGVKRV